MRTLSAVLALALAAGAGCDRKEQAAAPGGTGPTISQLPKGPDKPGADASMKMRRE